MILRGFQVFYKDQFADLDVRIQDGRIVEIGPAIGGDRILLGHGEFLIPGGVDIHTHGCMGSDFSDCTYEQLEEMDRYYLGHGITTVVATVMTEEKKKMEHAICNLCQYMDSGQNRTIQGIRLEGPFLSKERKGAHREDMLCAPDEDLWNHYQAISRNRILITDIAPELPGAMDCIKKWSKRFTCSLAHTNCSYNEAMEAFEAGADHVTHLYNAMAPLHHRKPGLVGATFTQKPYTEMICDGVHIHPAVIENSFDQLPKKLVMISDSMSACGLTEGTYDLGGQAVTVEGNRATLQDGTLAGAVTDIMDDMRYLVQTVGMPLEQVLPSLTRIPSESIHKGKQLGRIALGARDNLVVLNDELEEIAVCHEGEFYGEDGLPFPEEWE